MSSPISGRPALINFFSQTGLLAINTGMQFKKADAGIDGRLGVKFGGLLGADRQVVQQNIGAAVFQDFDDVDWLGLWRYEKPSSSGCDNM